ncbi:hypothetical protein BEK98_41885 [Streptomyces diastatochromogenes]|uniref:ABC transporter domain-containing protein n=1 Tax=Streptomyces diastatochromogenes TaxID=42236 RepID=A0A233RYV9_STRDA|nr:hypothetical protein BEK98_41885 [Streptomyces diastatochromogenes]
MSVSPATSTQTALRARGVRKAFGKRFVLAGVDLTIRPGQIVGIVGENGAGKTTLLRIRCGDLRPLSQKLAFGCQEVKEGLAFVGLGPGQGEGDGQALKGADQVQAQAPEGAAVAGAVAVFGPTCQVGAFEGLSGAAAFHRGGVHDP